MTTLQIRPEPVLVERRPGSYQDYLEQTAESRIAEWVDGEIIEYMPPFLRHQEITWFLFSLLKGYVEALDLGLVGAAPFEFKLWPEGPSREPDVFYISLDRLERLTEKRYVGPPDIAIEVISTSSVREDRVRKFSEYEQAGVAEYWIIDPRPHHNTAEFYRRGDEGLFQPVEPDEEGRYESAALPRFWLNVAWLQADPLPSYQKSLADIFSAGDNSSGGEATV